MLKRAALVGVVCILFASGVLSQESVRVGAARRWDEASTSMASVAVRRVRQSVEILRELSGPFCLSAYGDAPPQGLVAALRDVRQLRPLLGSNAFEREMCGGFIVDVADVTLTAPRSGLVKVAVDAPGAGWDCQVSVVRTTSGWVAELARGSCVHYQTR